MQAVTITTKAEFGRQPECLHHESRQVHDRDDHRHPHLDNEAVLVPDDALSGYRFIPGQFARLGVRKQTAEGEKIVWRAYSIVSADYDEFLEFYSIVVPGGEFTSTLADLKVGDEILIDRPTTAR
jgi:NAD(P)H-flavin reductase